MIFACPECGHRQADHAACGKCGYDGVLDTRNPKTIELLLDIDQRLRDRRTGRIRLAAVAFAMIVIMSLWLVPGYWHVRGRYYPGLPLLADQFGFMILIALGMSKMLESTIGTRRRFPYVSDDGTLH